MVLSGLRVSANKSKQQEGTEGHREVRVIIRPMKQSNVCGGKDHMGKIDM